jgi:hypothetical protein
MWQSSGTLRKNTEKRPYCVFALQLEWLWEESNFLVHKQCYVYLYDFETENLQQGSFRGVLRILLD